MTTNFPLDDQTRWILGRPNFACARIAETLRRGGMEIKCRAEDEQAAVIHWMLHLYFEHGAGWRGVAEKLLAGRAEETTSGEAAP